jgi:hypothetical protein
VAPTKEIWRLFSLKSNSPAHWYGLTNPGMMISLCPVLDWGRGEIRIKLPFGHILHVLTADNIKGYNSHYIKEYLHFL